MNKDDLRELIKNFIREEIEYHKKDMIKEIKAELFDILFSSSKQEIKENVNEKPTSSKKYDFLDRYKELLSEDTDMIFNTSNVKLPSSKNSNGVILPDTFEGQLTEKHEEVLEAINRDYSKLMKKLGV